MTGFTGYTGLARIPSILSEGEYFRYPQNTVDSDTSRWNEWADLIIGSVSVTPTATPQPTPTPTVTGIPSTGSITRSVSPSTIQTGSKLNITLTPSPTALFDSPGYQVTETIPQGFTFVGASTGNTSRGNVYTFTQIGSSPITYSLTAPSTTGSYLISGIFKDEARDTGMVSGATNIRVGGGYDANGNGRIDRSEAIQAVMDYFNGIITRQEAIDVVMTYFNG